MSTVTSQPGPLEEDDRLNKRVHLKGTAQMFEGDDELLIEIPTIEQAADGRELLVKWRVVLVEAEIGEPSTFSWNSLTQDQWNSMTQDQWNEMPQ